LVWQALRTGDVQCLGAAAELALPAQSLMAAGALALLSGGLASRDRRLVAGATATIAAQGFYVLGGLAIAGGTGLILDGLVRVPAFAAGRLRVLGRVASGRGAQTWVRTVRREETREHAAR
jgi:hypothetical protein